jgi:hypothetical protein
MILPTQLPVRSLSLACRAMICPRKDGTVVTSSAAPFLSDAALIGIGAAALLAGVLIAVTQSSNQATTTTH